jgi:ribosomal protein L30/L7E
VALLILNEEVWDMIRKIKGKSATSPIKHLTVNITLIENVIDTVPHIIIQINVKDTKQNAEEVNPVSPLITPKTTIPLSP